MIDFPALHDIVDSTPSKVVMIVVDGLGGCLLYTSDAADE